MAGEKDDPVSRFWEQTAERKLAERRRVALLPFDEKYEIVLRMRARDAEAREAVRGK